MQKKRNFSVLLVGDVVGDPGLEVCSLFLPQLRKEKKLDFIVVNGENSAKDGRGLTEKSCKTLFEAGADVITTGNHVWRHEAFYPYLQKTPSIVRPLNFPAGALGKGYHIVSMGGVSVAVVNVMGRVFFREQLGCPFRETENLLLYLKDRADIILVDFHAEATSEKQALAFYLDGKIHALVGTHTHVQTADNRILPKGCGYMSDLGFCGAINSCLGVHASTVINQYLSQMPARYRVETEGPRVLCGAILSLELDEVANKWISRSLERVMLPL
jgi:metallophosphoesterase (TIGR00282 family)